MFKKILHQINSSATYFKSILRSPNKQEHEKLTAALIETPEEPIEEGLPSCQLCLEDQNESNQAIIQDDCICENRHNFHISCLLDYWSTNEELNQFKCCLSQKTQAQTISFQDQKILIIQDRSIANALKLPTDDSPLKKMTYQIKNLIRIKQYLIKIQNYNQDTSDIANTFMGFIAGTLIDSLMIGPYRAYALSLISFNSDQNNLINIKCNATSTCVIKTVAPFPELKGLCQSSPISNTVVYGGLLFICSHALATIMIQRAILNCQLNLGIFHGDPDRLNQKFNIRAAALTITLLCLTAGACDILYEFAAGACSYTGKSEFWDIIQKNYKDQGATFINFTEEPNYLTRLSCFTPLIFTIIIALINQTIIRCTNAGLTSLNNKTNKNIAEHESQLTNHINLSACKNAIKFNDYTSAMYSPNITLFTAMQNARSLQTQMDQQTYSH